MPIIIPKELLLTIPCTKMQPNAEFRGTPDINRLLNGDPACFIDEDCGTQETPKTFIIADWTASSRRAEEITQLQAKLAELIKQGAVLYLWQNGKVLPLPKERLFLLNDNKVLKRMQQLQSDATILHATLRDHPSLKDKKPQVFDDYYCDYLLNDFQRIPERKIPLDVFQKQHDRALAQAVLKQKNPPVKLICTNSSDALEKDILDLLRTEFEIGLPVEFERSDPQVLLTCLNIDNMENISINKDSRRKPPLSAVNIYVNHKILTEVYLTAELEAGDLDLLFERYPLIQTLTLEIPNNLDEKCAPTKPTPLEKLVIGAGGKIDYEKDDPIPDTQLLQFIKNSPQLKHFTLVFFQLSQKMSELLSNRSLRTIHLKKCQLDETWYEMLTKDLESLDLEDIHIDLKASAVKPLSKLRRFRLTQESSDFYCDWRCIANFLQDAQPEELVLFGDFWSKALIENSEANIEVLSEIERLNLSRLITLALGGNELMEMSSFEVMLKKTMMLQNLTITAGFFQNEKLSQNGLCLPHLKKLNVELDWGGDKEIFFFNIKVLLQDSSSTIEKLNIEFHYTPFPSNFLTQCAHLKSLTLNKVFFDSPLLFPQWMQLQHLTLGEDCWFLNNSLETILSNVKTLHELDLLCNHVIDLEKDFYFPDLQQLTVNSNLSFHNLKKLIDASPALQRIIITCSDYSRLDQAQTKQLLKNRKIQCIWDDQLLKDEPVVEEKQQAYVRSQQSQQQTVTANTRYNHNEVVHVDPVFFSLDPNLPHPNPRENRCEAFQVLKVNPDVCDQNNAFFFENTEPLHLVELNHPLQIHHDLEALLKAHKKLTQAQQRGWLLGEAKFSYQGEPLALPSRSSREQLCDLCVDPPGTQVKLAYCKRDNMYYLTAAPLGQTITLFYKIKLPLRKPPFLFPKDIRDKITEIKNANPGELDFSILPKNLEEFTGKDFLTCLQKQNLGSCVHRMVLFMDYMQQRNKKNPHEQFKLRSMFSATHAWVEVFTNGHWYGIELGGYSVKKVMRPSTLAERLSNTASSAKEEKALAHRESKEEKKEEEVPAREVRGGQPPAQPKVARKISNRSAYEAYFSTWDSGSLHIKTPEEYCRRLLETGRCRKRLVELDSEESIHPLRLHLQQHCQHIKRPFYYIDSSADLFLSDFAKKENNTVRQASYKERPLYQFLLTHRKILNSIKKPPLLFINFNNFTREDLIRFNTLLDEDAKALGLFLPLHLDLIAFISKKTEKDAAVYSRLPHETCPLSQETLSQAFAGLLPKKCAKPPQSIDIDLFQSAFWEQLLLGKIEYGEQGLCFSEGKLINAWKTKSPIHLKNAPWHDPKFRAFWQQAFLDRQISYAGETIHLPAYFQPHSLTDDTKTGYDWAQLLPFFALTQGLSTDIEALALNPHVFSEFFAQYQFPNLNRIDGAIKTHAKQFEGRPLHLNLTRALSVDAWARLLEECKTQAVHVVVHYVDESDLQELGAARMESELKVALEEKGEEKEEEEKQQGAFMDPPLPKREPVWNQSITAHTTAIVSTDYYSTLKTIRAQKETYLVMDISDCHHDLRYRYMPQETKNGSPHIERLPQEIITRLEKGENIVLKGMFSPKLLDALAPFLLARQASPKACGHLILLSEEDNLHYLKAQYHDVSVEEKTQHLKQAGFAQELELLRPYLPHEPLSKLMARLKHARATTEGMGTTPNLNAWRGVWQHQALLKFPDFDKAQAAQIAQNFDDKRLHAVKEMHKQSLFAVITGLTGVGKTTFIEKHFASNDNQVLYCGKDKLQDWVNNTECKQDGSAKEKFLFLDEGNFELYLELMGLLDNEPPGIFINGCFHKGSPHHKVILAFNPANYSADRKISSFIDHHGCAIPFDPMPLEYLYINILMPVFKNQGLDANDVDDLCAHFLNIYRSLCELNPHEILITPRELQMMCLMACARIHKKQISQQTLLQIKQDAYQIALPLVPKNQLSQFNSKFRPKVADLETLAYKPPALPDKDFLITEAVLPLCQQMEGLIDLHEMYQEIKLEDATDAFYFGGLGGAKVEGPPGIGKSKLSKQLLLARHYQEIPFTEESFEYIRAKKGHFFCCVPQGLKREEEIKLSAKAIDYGLFVIKDEFNATPLPEPVMNNLLMRRIPPANKRPEKPGGFYLALQNPGRIPLSPAVEKRFWQLELKDYPIDEIRKILRHKGLSEQRISKLSAAFCAMRQKAQIEQLQPPPTTRALFALADTLALEEHKHQAHLTFVEQITMLVNDAPAYQKNELLKLVKTLKDLMNQWINLPALKANEPTLSQELKDCITTLRNTIDNAPSHLQKPEPEFWQRLFAWWNQQEEDPCVLPLITPILNQFKQSLEEVINKPEPKEKPKIENEPEPKKECESLLVKMRAVPRHTMQPKQQQAIADFIAIHQNILRIISQPNAITALETKLRKELSSVNRLACTENLKTKETVHPREPQVMELVSN